MWCTSTSEWTSTNKESRIGAERKSEFWTHPFAYSKNGYPNFLWLTLNHRTILQKNRGLHAIYQHRYEWTIINGTGRRKETRTLDSPFDLIGTSAKFSLFDPNHWTILQKTGWMFFLSPFPKWEPYWLPSSGTGRKYFSVCHSETC